MNQVNKEIKAATQEPPAPQKIKCYGLTILSPRFLTLTERPSVSEADSLKG